MSDIVSQIIAYEAGDMSDDECLAFFQTLIDSGLVWNLQGHYGRTAVRLIEAGLCSAKPTNSGNAANKEK